MIEKLTKLLDAGKAFDPMFIIALALCVCLYRLAGG